MSNTHHVKGRVLITGVSTGIGKAIALHLMRNNYQVIGSVRSTNDAKSLVEQWPEHFVPAVFDVTDTQSIERSMLLVKEALKGEPLNAIINNAGISHAGPIIEQPINEIMQSFNVNVFGMLAVTRTFLPLLTGGNKQTKKNIINISSVSGGMTVPFLGTYSATKHAVEAYTQALRRELSLFGIQVTAIEPGMIKTELFDKASADGVLDKYNNTPYEKLWKLFNHSLRKQEAKAKPAQKVADAVFKTLNTNKAKSRMPLDFSWFMGKILPDKVFDKIICKELGIDDLLTQSKD